MGTSGVREGRLLSGTDHASSVPFAVSRVVTVPLVRPRVAGGLRPAERVGNGTRNAYGTGLGWVFCPCLVSPLFLVMFPSLPTHSSLLPSVVTRSGTGVRKGVRKERSTEGIIMLLTVPSHHAFSTSVTPFRNAKELSEMRRESVTERE